MSSSIVVELNEKSANTINYKNGDYKVLLKKPILLEKGDVVKLKGAVVDSVSKTSENNIVNIDPDTPNGTTKTIGFTFAYYQIDWGSSFEDTGAALDPVVVRSNRTAASIVSYRKDGTGAFTGAGTPPQNTGLPMFLNYQESITALQKNNMLIEQIAYNCPDSSAIPSTKHPGKSQFNILFGIDKFFTSYTPPPPQDPTPKQNVVEELFLGFSIIFDPSPTGADMAAINKCRKPGSPPTFIFNKANLEILKTANLYFPFTSDKSDLLVIPPAFPIACFAEAPTVTGRDRFLAPNRPNIVAPWQILYTPEYGQTPTGAVNQQQDTPTTTMSETMVDASTFAVSTTPEYTLYKETVQIEIPARAYEASDLAEVMTDKLTNINLTRPANEVALPSDPTDSLSEAVCFNPFIKTIKQLAKETEFKLHPAAGGELERAAQEPIFIGQSFSKGQTNLTNPGDYFSSFQYDTTISDFVIGTTQVAVLFDEAHDKFTFGQIHSHIYDTATPNNSSPQVRIREITDFGISVSDRAGGVVFTDLTPASFWFGSDSVMKFDKSTVLGVPETTKVVSSAAGNPEFIITTIPLTVGQNATADVMGLDNLVQKSARTGDITGASCFDTKIAIGAGITKSTSIDTVPIKAAFTQNPNVDLNVVKKQGGYFKLQVEMPNIKNDVVEANRTNSNIHSIINRFYSDGQYTSAYDEGSMPVVYNQAEPSYLDSFNVRILAPDGNVADPLGNTSTVFIQIDKAN